MPRKPGKVPTYAKNQTDLGSYLSPPRDRKIIQQALKLEGNPGRTKDGRYHIAEWDGFIRANFASIVDPTCGGGGGGDKRNLEMEKLRLQNEKLKFELEVKRKDYSANSDVEVWVGEMVMRAKTVLQALPAKLAPQIIGLTEVEAEKRLREEINDALAQLTGPA